MYKKGNLSDDEKRRIEQMIQFDSYAEIARKLNRNPSTIRKYCQSNNLTKDVASRQKNIENRVKRSPYFEELNRVLTDSEMDAAVKTYSDLMDQFGSDVLASEEIQVVDFCIISALLNRALAREKEINKLLTVEYKIKDKLEAEQETIQDDDEKSNWYDRMDKVDLRIHALTEELKQIKKNQNDNIKLKDNATKAMNGSRNQRAKDLEGRNENWVDFIVYLKTHPEFRREVGNEIEKMRLAINEEYIRLSAPYEYADGEIECPVLNAGLLEGAD